MLKNTFSAAVFITLTLLSNTAARADEPATFTGEVGLGVSQTQAIIRGADTSTGLFPYLAFDYGRAFARIDTFGVKTLKVGYGSLEVIGRYRADGYQVAGLAHRGNSVPLGLGTLQVTPIGAFEVNVVHDFSDSAGNIALARYIAKIPAGPVSLYPEIGVEMLDARYTNYYYGIRDGNALNPFAGILVATKLGERWALNTYFRRTLLDDGIAHSSNVNRGGRNTMFVALARVF